MRMITAMSKGKEAADETGGTGQQPEPRRWKPGEWRRSIPGEPAQAVITVETARAAATVEIVAAVLRQPGAGNAPAARVPPFVIYSVKTSGPGALHCTADPGEVQTCETGKRDKRDRRSDCGGDHGVYRSGTGRNRKQWSGIPHHRCTECAARAESTSSERIGLNAGVTVEYVRAHDDDWAGFIYNGRRPMWPVSI